MKIAKAFIVSFKQTINRDEIKYSNFYSNSKTEHSTDIDNVLKSIYSTIMKKIWKHQVEGPGWTIHSVIEQKTNISKCKPLSGTIYISLPTELNNSKIDLIDIQNSDDDECLKWRLVRYLNSPDHHPARIRKID